MIHVDVKPNRSYHVMVSDFLTTLVAKGASIITTADGMAIGDTDAGGEVIRYCITPMGYLRRNIQDCYGRLLGRAELQADGTWKVVKLI